MAPGRAQLNLGAQRLDVEPLLAAERVTAIINCGAYTKVDQAEDEPALAMRINGEAPGALAIAARAAGIPIVQISTDYVFAGDKPAPYVEDDPTGPASTYGRSKLAGELAVRESGARHAILRTAWVFSGGGANFVRTMLRLGRERDVVSVVRDQHGCPTHAEDLAQAVVAATLALEEGHASGTWHVANSGETTWYGLAERVFARAAQHGRPAPVLTAIPTSAYPTKAPRPGNSRLACDRFYQDFGIRLRPWQEAADAAVDALLAGEGESAR